MDNQINISFPFQKVVFLAFVFSTFCSLDAFAQGEERSRNIPETKVEDNFGAMESPEAHVIDYSAKPSSNAGNILKERSLNNPANKNTNIYKQAGEKDVKKENVSTLSFNLFMYIVDKFKED